MWALLAVAGFFAVAFATIPLVVRPGAIWRNIAISLGISACIFGGYFAGQSS